MPVHAALRQRFPSVLRAEERESKKGVREMSREGNRGDPTPVGRYPLDKTFHRSSRWAIHFLFLFVAAAGGFGLPVVYGVWMTVLALTYPVCTWFMRKKRTQNALWLRYL